MPKIIDYNGVKLGMLTLDKKIGKNKWGSNIWSYVCDCGKTGNICIQHFKYVEHHSCGCNSKHDNNPRVKNMTLLKAYSALIRRCYEPTNRQYHNYGGRGISVSERWRESYNNFYDDMIGAWQKGLQLDRENNNGNYCKENCRWVTHKVNSRNRRTDIINKEIADFIRNSDLSNHEHAKMFGITYEHARKIKKYRTCWID